MFIRLTAVALFALQFRFGEGRRRLPPEPRRTSGSSVSMQLFSAAPRLLPRSTESIWFSSPALDEDAALTEMEASLEAQVAAAHVTLAPVLAPNAATVCRSFSRSETSTPTCLSWVGRDGRVGLPLRTTT